MLPDPHGQSLGDASDRVESFFGAVADAIGYAIADVAGVARGLQREMVIGSIFSDEFLHAAAHGEFLDVPLATIMPMLAMENLMLRRRVQNLEATLNQLQELERNQVLNGDE